MALRSLAASLLFAVLFPVSTWRPAVADSTDPPIPGSLFPLGSRVLFEMNVPNSEMDQQWGRDASGQPFMHLGTEADFARQSGWMEEGFYFHGSSYYLFQIYSSRYGTAYGPLGGVAGNIYAFADLHYSVAGYWGLTPARSQPKHLLPDGANGQSETLVLPFKYGGPTVTIAAWWGPSQEIEGLAIFTTDLMSLTQGKRVLANEIRYATRLP